MMRAAVLAVTDRRITRKLVTETRAGRAVAHRFVAGDSLTDAIAVARGLNADGLLVSLDHLGEHVADPTEAQRACTAYLECLTAIGSSGIRANISIKLTQLGMGLDDGVAAAHLDTLASAAREHGTTVTIDMEESAHTGTTVDLYEAAQRTHGNLGIAVQSYLRRTPADLDRIMPLGGHIRLCKGAYAEHADVAFTSTAQVDDAFDRLAMLMMASDTVIPAIATHDDARIRPVIEVADRRSRPWEFQMLYGVRRDRQLELAAEGHQVRVYVPFGEAWYPYLTRRLAERPANLSFFARAMVGG